LFQDQGDSWWWLIPVGFISPFFWAYALWGFIPSMAVLALEVVLVSRWAGVGRARWWAILRQLFWTMLVFGVLTAIMLSCRAAAIEAERFQ
jgi:hypothetical protein